MVPFLHGRSAGQVDCSGDSDRDQDDHESFTRNVVVAAAAAAAAV